jgi:hypothetical protein
VVPPVQAQVGVGRPYQTAGEQAKVQRLIGSRAPVNGREAFL